MTDGYNETSGARAAGNSRTPERHDWSVPLMGDGTESTPAEPQTTVCPMCRTAGWMSGGRMRTGVCGSWWTSEGLTTIGAACYVLAHRQDRIEELEFTLRDLGYDFGRVAAGKGVAA